jgi:hypothetical protein
VFYGAAEFSRDTDFAILAEVQNLARLRRALTELQAEPIAVPPFELKYLRRGHALHFRCRHPEALRLRVDLMSKMRGVDSFAKLWRRRTVLQLPDGTRCDLLSLPDLVQAKKTQRDKDWPMIRRLVEAHYFSQSAPPNAAHIKFWLLEQSSFAIIVGNRACQRITGAATRCQPALVTSGCFRQPGTIANGSGRRRG